MHIKWNGNLYCTITLPCGLETKPLASRAAVEELIAMEGEVKGLTAAQVEEIHRETERLPPERQPLDDLAPGFLQMALEGAKELNQLPEGPAPRWKSVGVANGEAVGRSAVILIALVDLQGGTVVRWQKCRAPGQILLLEDRWVRELTAAPANPA